jgi:hypothetical protein
MGVVSADADAELNRRAGANVERVTFDWRWAEPNPGAYNLGVYDQMYRSMRARGIRPIFILLFAPWWAWDPGVQCQQWTQNCMYPPSAAHFADAGRMAALLATRYPEAAGIEVWNEPNLSAFWKPQPDVLAYTGLLKATYSAVKNANPSMPVISGGFNNAMDTTGPRISLADFTGAVYALGGKDYMDAIGFHPYPLSLDHRLLDISFKQVRDIRHNFNDDAKPLWVTEVGLTTTDPNRPLTEAQQAGGLVDLYRTLRAMPDVKTIVFHTLIDVGNDPFDPETGYGVLRSDLSPKPAYCALAAAAGSPCSPG